MSIKRNITVGLDAYGVIRAAHISTAHVGLQFCRNGGLSPMIVEWDGKSPMIGRYPDEIATPKPKALPAPDKEPKNGD